MRIVLENGRVLAAEEKDAVLTEGNLTICLRSRSRSSCGRMERTCSSPEDEISRQILPGWDRPIRDDCRCAPAALQSAFPTVTESVVFLCAEDTHFDADLASFTVHQWSDLMAGLAEMRTTTRRLVLILGCEPAEVRQFPGSEERSFRSAGSSSSHMQRRFDGPPKLIVAHP